ncbi:MAG: hypothetical protein M1831_007345 [Alyxoria varia]|nr:MAG: hypothetical protein M1831_007345 [Alyxoria varia]
MPITPASGNGGPTPATRRKKYSVRVTQRTRRGVSGKNAASGPRTAGATSSSLRHANCSAAAGNDTRMAADGATPTLDELRRVRTAYFQLSPEERRRKWNDAVRSNTAARVAGRAAEGDATRKSERKKKKKGGLVAGRDYTIKRTSVNSQGGKSRTNPTKARERHNVAGSKAANGRRSWRLSDLLQRERPRAVAEVRRSEKDDKKAKAAASQSKSKERRRHEVDTVQAREGVHGDDDAVYVYAPAPTRPTKTSHEEKVDDTAMGLREKPTASSPPLADPKERKDASSRIRSSHSHKVDRGTNAPPISKNDTATSKSSKSYGTSKKSLRTSRKNEKSSLRSQAYQEAPIETASSPRKPDLEYTTVPREHRDYRHTKSRSGKSRAAEQSSVAERINREYGTAASKPSWLREQGKGTTTTKGATQDPPERPKPRRSKTTTSAQYIPTKPIEDSEEDVSQSKKADRSMPTGGGKRSSAVASTTTTARKRSSTKKATSRSPVGTDKAQDEWGDSWSETPTAVEYTKGVRRSSSVFGSLVSGRTHTRSQSRKKRDEKT